MKAKIGLFVFIFIFINVLFDQVYAEKNASPEGLRNNTRKENMVIRRDIIQDVKNKIKENIQGGIKQIKSLSARLVNADVTNISGNTVTVTLNTKTYTVNTDLNTRFIRHFWGKSSLSEISIGDKLNIWGKYTDDLQTIIQAKLIRNMSVMKRFGVFVGMVSNFNNTNFTFTFATVQRGNQNVTFASTTKCVNRKNVVMNCSDIQNGHRIRVRGVWDKTNSTIKEITEIKDYSIPVQVTPTPKI
ncbi:MAG: DUF5666 domain-containing protein [bacterium]|nr:DUF5666 domain-containing protein [bacterium]